MPTFKSLSNNLKIQLDLSTPNSKKIYQVLPTNHWWQENIELNEAHKINKGDNETIVAVIDTGVDYLHQDLKNNVHINHKEIPSNGVDDDQNGYIDDYYGFNSFTGSGSGMDDNGHGTHCAGIVAANGQLKGVAPNVKILPLKFLNNYGQGDIAKAITAITYAVKMGAKIITNSYGNPNSNAAFLEAVKYASENGVLFFAAAGNAKNDNDLRGEYPANYHLDNVISVASNNSENRKSSFSNFGQLSVDIFAPGENIYSLDVNNRYKTRSGTSMATPMAAGIAALIWSEYPSLSSTEVASLIKTTSSKSANFYKLSQTPGTINALTALTKTKTPNIYPFPRSEIRTINYQLKSDSPYQNNTNKPYEISVPDSKAMSINFDLIDIENGYDYLQIESKSGAVLKKLRDMFPEADRIF